MATTLIRNGFFTGALNGALIDRGIKSATLTDYDVARNAADAFAAQCLTANAALGAPMADADNTEIGQLCEAVASAAVAGRGIKSATATDYSALATAAVAAAKESVAKLV